jgi:uncharacterized protein (TIGR03437 family)
MLSSLRRALLLPAIFSLPLFAAPKLRLTNASVFLKQSPGVASPNQTIYAYNIGDGSLNLSLSISPKRAWLTASVGPSEPCSSSAAVCIPLRFGLQTSNLAPGAHTAEIAVSDPNAADAPQIVTLTVQVDPAASSVSAYVNPGSMLDVTIPPPPGTPAGVFSAPPTTTVSTTDGGHWLSVSLGYASYATLSYLASLIIHFTPPAAMPTGVYSGQISLSDMNGTQTVAVTMNVVTGPIANPSIPEISMTLAQDSAPLTYPFLPYISLSNSGNGSLQVTSVVGSGTGVSAYDYGGLAIVTLDPGTLAVGTYTDGVVTIQCNGANCPIQIPVRLTIEPQAPPQIYFALPASGQSVFAAPGDVCYITGDQLSLQPAVVASYPLPIYLGHAGVYVNGVSAPLYYTSYGQIAFQVPYSTPTGNASIQMVRDNQASNIVTMPISAVAPEIVVITDTAYNVIDVDHPATAGEPIVIWAFGLGATNPPVAEGVAAPANPPAAAAVTPAVQFNYATGPTLPVTSVQVTPSFAGLTPGEAGAYQVIVTVPSISGTSPGVSLITGSNVESNVIQIAVK